MSTNNPTITIAIIAITFLLVICMTSGYSMVSPSTIYSNYVHLISLLSIFQNPELDQVSLQVLEVDPLVSPEAETRRAVLPVLYRFTRSMIDPDGSIG